MRIADLTETFDNLLPQDPKREILGPQVFDLLTQAYQSIGGIKGNGFNSVEDMIQNVPFWKIFRRGKDIKAVMLYKDKGGRKRVAMATDGTPDSKAMLAKMIADEHKFNRSYGEISGPSLRFHQRVLGDEFDKVTIPVEQVKKMVDDEIRPVSNFEYQRNIGGEWITKRMIGNPGNKIT